VLCTKGHEGVVAGQLVSLNHHHQHHRHHISNNSSFRQKHPGVQDGSDGSDRTSYPLTENYMLSVTQVMGHVA